MSEQPTTPAEANEQLDEFVSRFGEYEDLDPELVRYLTVSERFGECIKHPLVYSIMHFPILNASMNKNLKAKKEACRRALSDNDWHHYVFLHERPYRSDAFMRIKSRLTDEQYWDLLSEIWIDSENIRQNQRRWINLLRAKRPGREHMMNEADRDALAAMPDTLSVFQGHTDERDDGWSWTLDRSKAEWFAHRFAQLEEADPVLSFGTCSKADVVAYLTRRGEDEILVDRSKVTICGVRPLPHRTTSSDSALVTTTADALITTSNAAWESGSDLTVDFT
jgi:hypothetical protein